MADEGKKRGKLTDAQWKELRQSWCAGTRDGALGKQYGVTRQTIISHRQADAASGDPWILTDDLTLSNRQVSDSVKNETKSKVVDIATRQAMSQPEIQRAIDDAARQVASELLDTYEIAREASTAMKNLFRGINDGSLKPAQRVGEQNQAQFISEALSALTKFTNTVRLGYGIPVGKPTVATDDGSDRPDRIIFEIDFGPNKPTGTDGADPYGPEKV